MAHLIYTANSSLDGYTEDKDGKFDWTAPTMSISGLSATSCAKLALISTGVECMRP